VRRSPVSLAVGSIPIAAVGPAGVDSPAVTAESPDLMHPVQADRRPAIWPWLVMPLIALTAFYCLERLAKEAREQADLDPATPAAIHAEAAAEAATMDSDAK
jgi:hypothetical protein